MGVDGLGSSHFLFIKRDTSFSCLTNFETSCSDEVMGGVNWDGVNGLLVGGVAMGGVTGSLMSGDICNGVIGSLVGGVNEGVALGTVGVTCTCLSTTSVTVLINPMA